MKNIKLNNINLNRRKALIIASGIFAFLLALTGGVKAVISKGKAKINSFKCSNCLQCTQDCPNGAITKGLTHPKINLSKCTGCGFCAMDCPAGAITVS